MPVTAKLSLRFYEKLGEDVANELVEWFNSVDTTYRSDLRELNELNFARFDAKLEQRLAELRREISREIVLEGAALRKDIRADLEVLRTDLGIMRADVDGMRKEIGGIQGEIGSVRGEMGVLRADLIKWSFVFFATAALAVIGLR